MEDFFYCHNSDGQPDRFADRSKDVALNSVDSVGCPAATRVACRQPESDYNYLMDDCHRRGYEHKLHDACGWHDQYDLCDNELLQLFFHVTR
jgi:hypothetical protein